jgi:hypothetical protein
MALVVWVSVHWLQGLAGPEQMAGVWLAALGGGVLAVTSYGGAALLLQSAEARWLLNLVARR